MTSKKKSASVDDFIGKKIKSDLSALPVQRVNKAEDEKAVYASRFEPTDMKDGEAFFDASAIAYELYIICSNEGIIENVNFRVEQCQCGHRSFASHSAPAWMFPSGAMFEIDWEDIASICQKRIIKLLNDITLVQNRI